MPIYDFECKNCNIIEERIVFIQNAEEQFCTKCNHLMTKLIGSTKKDWFRKHYNENFTDKPVFVESKEHMKKLCKKYGVYARCLM